MDWPKRIVIRGIAIEVGSWEEFDEVVTRYGSEDAGDEISMSRRSENDPGKQRRPSSLGTSDRTLLRHFVEAEQRGLLNKDLGPMVGKQGKGIGPALDAWGRRIGLTEEGATAFEKMSRGGEGRGYRMRTLYFQAAKELLGDS